MQSAFTNNMASCDDSSSTPGHNNNCIAYSESKYEWKGQGWDKNINSHYAKKFEIFKYNFQ